LFLSVLLRPEPERRIDLLPLIISIAAAEAIRETTEADVRLRWPNDLYQDGRKLGGVLCEGSFKGSVPEAFVAGIGINVDLEPEHLSESVRRSAGSLSAVDCSIDALLLAVVTRVEHWWNLGDVAPILPRYRELAEKLHDHSLRVEPRDGEPYEATTNGVAEDGSLSVRLPDGTARVLYAEAVTLLDDEDDGDDEGYYGLVESYFIERRGSPLFITPAEWFLISQWDEDGVPLQVVKAGIDRALDRPRNPGRTVKLSYCRQAVRAEFRNYREIELGAHRHVPEPTSTWSSHLAGIAAALSDGYPEISAAVEDLAKSGLDSGGLEDALEDLDKKLMAAAEEATESSARAELLDRAERSLASYRDRMPDKVYRAAVQSAYRKQLRRSLEIPLLSLLDT